MAVKIDLNKCTGCHECEIVCPYALFIIIDGKAQVDNKGCVSCGVCKQSCMEGAITVFGGKTMGGGY